MEVRAYRADDADRVRDICYATSTIDGMDKQLLTLLYADYYIQAEPHNAFILADEDDKAIGYILAAENYKGYISAYKNKYLKRVKSLSKKSAAEIKGSFLVLRALGHKYPAHLHIDILPEAQRGGWGTRLMDTLMAHLKAKGVKGVQLTVGAGNQKGINFYRKYGFKKIASLFGKAYVFGKKLN